MTGPLDHNRMRVEYGMLGISMDQESGVSLARQVYEGIRQAVLDGRLVPGQRLPSSRALADELGVARGTIVDAFDQLRAEGYLNARTGSGTFVDEIPEHFLNVTHRDRSNRRTVVNTHVSDRARESRALSEFAGVRAPRPFQPGLSPLDAFPRDIFARLLSQVARAVPYDDLAYGHPAGYLPLRRAIAEYLRTARAVRCEPEQVLITNGAQHALNIVAHTLLDQGDAVWIENPGYRGARAAFSKSGLRVVPVPVDRDGLSVDAGRQLASDGRLVYVTPSHQYPLGITMTLRRRLDLVEWARKNDSWILEDDYDSEYRYAGAPLPSLHHIDEYNRTIYCGSLSKVVAPAIRVGYLVVPSNLVDVFTQVRSADDWQSSILLQMALAQFIADGHFGRHLRRMRRLGGRRCEALVKAFEEHLPAYQLGGTEGGLHALLRLDDRTNDRLLAKRALDKGLNLSPLSGYDFGDTGMQGLVLGYAAFSEREISRGAEVLGRLMRSG